MLQGKDLKRASRALRRNATPWEQKLWYHLRGGRFYGFKFKRQVPMGSYVVDFCCQEGKLIVELDGSQHNLNENRELDRTRQTFLESKEYKVLRFWNNDIDTNLQGVLETIRINIHR